MSQLPQTLPGKTKSRDLERMPGPGVGFQPLPNKEPESKPPTSHPLLQCLTSQPVRLAFLFWAALALSLVAVTWFDVTAYHLTGSEIQDDTGVWGNIYDSTRTISKQGLNGVKGATDVIAAKQPTLLAEEQFDIANDDTKMPTGWHAVLIHGWMIVITAVNSLLALGVWFIVIKNCLVFCCRMKSLDADQEKREHRQEIASNVALAWQLLVPAMCWLIQRLTGYKNCGIAPDLYRRMMALGPLVLLGQKTLALLQVSIKEAEKHLNSAGDGAWSSCSSNSDSKTQAIKRCSTELCDKSHVVTVGPVWLQNLIGAALAGSVFHQRPFGICLYIFGFVDKHVVSQVTVLLLGVVPSWVDDEIQAVEAKFKEIGDDFEKAREHVVNSLHHFKNVFNSALGFLGKASDGVNHAHATTKKFNNTLGESMSNLIADTINTVGKGFGSLEDELKLVCEKIVAFEAELEKDAAYEIEKMKALLKELLDYLESLRPVNLLIRLETMADDALYGEIAKFMEKHKTDGAMPLSYSVGIGGA